MANAIYGRIHSEEFDVVKGTGLRCIVEGTYGSFQVMLFGADKDMVGEDVLILDPFNGTKRRDGTRDAERLLKYGNNISAREDKWVHIPENALTGKGTSKEQEANA